MKMIILAECQPFASNTAAILSPWFNHVAIHTLSSTVQCHDSVREQKYNRNENVACAWKVNVENVRTTHAGRCTGDVCICLCSFHWNILDTDEQGACISKKSNSLRRFIPDCASIQSSREPQHQIITWYTESLGWLRSARTSLTPHSSPMALPLMLQEWEQTSHIISFFIHCEPEWKIRMW